MTDSVLGQELQDKHTEGPPHVHPDAPQQPPAAVKGVSAVPLGSSVAAVGNDTTATDCLSGGGVPSPGTADLAARHAGSCGRGVVAGDPSWADRNSAVVISTQLQKRTVQGHIGLGTVLSKVCLTTCL